MVIRKVRNTHYIYVHLIFHKKLAWFFSEYYYYYFPQGAGSPVDPLKNFCNYTMRF